MAVMSSREGGESPSQGEERGLRATIVNCYPDHNKGSSALAAGMIARLRRTGRVDQIDVVSLHRRMNQRSDFRHLMAMCPDITIMRSPLRDQPVGATVGKVLFTAYISARTAGIRAEVVRARRGSDPAMEAIVSSDLVLERGGPFFKGMGAPPNPSLLRYAWPLALARTAGIPYTLLGQSVGPLTNSFAKRVVRELFESAGLASVREDISGEVLVDAGVADDCFSTMLDNAFWTVPFHSEAVEAVLLQHSLKGRRFLAVTCRDRRTPAEEATYLDEMASAIDALVPGVFEAVAIVPNLFNPAGPESDDRRMSRALHQRLGHNPAVQLVEADLRPDELAAFYGEAALVLGHRLHSLILGVLGGTPVVGIASSVGPKTVGVLQLLGLHDFVVPIKTLHGDELVERVKVGAEGQPEVAKRVEELRVSSDATFDAYIDRVAAGNG